MMGPLRFGIPVTISCTICADNLQVLDFNFNPLLKKLGTLAWLTFCETTLSFKYLEQRGNHPINLPAHLGECLALPWLSGLHLSLGHWSEHHSGRAMHSNECLVRTLLDDQQIHQGQHFDCLSFRQEFDQTHCRWVYCLWGPSVKSMGEAQWTHMTGSSCWADHVAWGNLSLNSGELRKLTRSDVQAILSVLTSGCFLFRNV